MVDYTGRIKELEEEISSTKYNKATQHHIGLTKAKIARLREKIEVRKSQKSAGSGFFVRKSGDATVVLIGFPSVGKSTLLNKLTNAESKVAPYAFTTLTCIPGMMEYRKAKIQILDVPGVIEGAAKGTGRGRESLTVLRSADMVLILAEATMPGQLEVLNKELYDSGFRLNQKKPDVRIKKIERGGILVGSSVPLTKLDERTIKDILIELRYTNCNVLIREDIAAEQLIDAVAGNRCYIPSIVVFNKCDTASHEQLRKIEKLGLPISAEIGTNIDKLKEEIYNKLELISIYLKQVGKKADLKEPLIVRNGTTVKNICERLHRDFVARFRFARIWGRSAKFPGQKKGLEHLLLDGDILQIHVR